MLTFVIRRMIATVFVVFTITVLVFLIFFHTPGVDPARKLAGRNPSPETIKAIKHQYGLDRPLPVQYVMLMILALIGISMPVFWLGEMANLITQDRYHDTFLFSWVPPLGYTPLTQDPVMWFKHLVIPWLVLSVLYIGLYARVLRASLLETENEDYVRTARAKGLSGRRVLLRHTLRTS